MVRFRRYWSPSLWTTSRHRTTDKHNKTRALKSCARRRQGARGLAPSSCVSAGCFSPRDAARSRHRDSYRSGEAESALGDGSFEVAGGPGGGPGKRRLCSVPPALPVTLGVVT